MEQLPKIQKIKVSDQVFDLLRQSIAEGKFKPGERLPSENELCASLGVSRPSVNAAMNRLRAMGLVETRPGDGSYVKFFSSADYIHTYADLVMDHQNITDILEVRQALDVESFRLAMERAEEADIRELENLCGHYLQAKKDKDYETMARYDFAFHLHICECSKNRFFPEIYRLVGSLIYKQIKLFGISRAEHNQDGDHAEDSHTLICQALRQKDFDLYLKVMAEHIDYETHKP